MFQKIINIVKNVYGNHFEIASFLGSSLIILLAILLDTLLNLRACPLCILTRYIFGVIALMSLIGYFLKRFYVLNKLIVAFASAYGIIVSLKIIYLQNLTPEEIAMLPMGCDMPLETQI
jgi:disulfide bond formation protein DsbB